MPPAFTSLLTPRERHLQLLHTAQERSLIFITHFLTCVFKAFLGGL